MPQKCNTLLQRCIYYEPKRNDMKKALYFGIAALAIAGCSKFDAGEWFEGEFKGGDAYYESADGGGGSVGGDNGNGQGQSGEAGVITAAEWNDLDNWAFWGNLMTSQSNADPESENYVPSYSEYRYYWGLNTGSRFAVKVKDASGNPVVGAKIELKDESGKTLWKSVSDNKGLANLWADVFTKDPQTVTGSCTVAIDNVAMEGNPVMTSFNEEARLNEYVVAHTGVGNNVDIAFIVDATGSMTDEINFLKEDLLDILNRCAQIQSDKKLFTGAVFYRDQGDDYLTRVQGFSDNVTSTTSFVKKQEAAGGGDTPEAVHTALEVSLSDLQWHTNAYSRMAFIILDAPAHKDHQGVVESMQKSIAAYSEKGIKLIPVFCSSYSKDCEFMCRQFAILTGGTYVFLTNDSGVGGEHIQATVGEYQVEHLNDLIVRLITSYIS